MLDALLWCGILVAAGAVVSLSARPARIPAASAALAGGLAVSWFASGWYGPPDPDPLGLVRSILLAILCFLLGSELDLTRVVRAGRPAILMAIVSTLAAMAMIWGAAALAGFDRVPATIIAAAAAAASPAATIALTSELRVRGERKQRILLAAPVSLLTSIVAIGATLGWSGYLAGWTVALGIGAVCGLVILIPLSRLATRGAIVACIGAGTIVLVGAGSRSLDGDTGVALASIVAGFMAGNLSSNREAIRDAMRDLSLPVAISLFALMGSTLLITSGSLIAVALVAAARTAAFVLVGFALGRKEGVVEAMSLIPIALLAPGLIAPASTMDARILPVLAGGVLLTQITAPIAARWMMIRTGAVSPTGDPDAWREAMR